MQAREARYYGIIWHARGQHATLLSAAQIKLILRAGSRIIYPFIACLVVLISIFVTTLNNQIWHGILCRLFWFPLLLWIHSPAVTGAHPAPSIMKKPVFYPVSRMCHLYGLYFIRAMISVMFYTIGSHPIGSIFIGSIF